MTTPRESATLVLSLCNSSAADAGRAGSEVVASLVRFLADHELQATWSTDCPAAWVHAALLAAEQPRQELALLGDASWAAQAVSRMTFAAELGRRMRDARAAGLAVSTLFVPGRVAPHHDLLAKHGITAVCSLSADAAPHPHGMLRLFRAGRDDSVPAAVVADRPRNLRWGLWELPAAVDLVRTSVRRGQQAVRSVARNGGIAHLRINLETLVAGGRRALGQLDAVLRMVVDCRQRGQLDSRTAAAATARLAPARAGVAAVSILRRAA